MRHVLGIYIEGRLWQTVVLDDFPGFNTGEPVTIGRRETCDICIKKNTVSRQHAQVKKVGPYVEIVDSGSLNKLNYKGKIYEKIRLENGMKIAIGGSISDPETVVIMYIQSGAEKKKEQKNDFIENAKEGIEKIKNKIDPVNIEKASPSKKSKGKRRLLAFMIDFAISVFMCIGLCGIIVIPFGIGGIIKYILVLCVMAVFWLYYALGESGENCSTTGKTIMQLKVVNVNGERLSFLKASVRFASKLLSVFTLFLPVFGKFRCLHDVIAGTKVINR
ncbi:MAG: RDD family protein [Clostridia bacterium]|nr:RDD family protein [Clostridia bacterium]